MFARFPTRLFSSLRRANSNLSKPRHLIGQSLLSAGESSHSRYRTYQSSGTHIPERANPSLVHSKQLPADQLLDDFLQKILDSISRLSVNAKMESKILAEVLKSPDPALLLEVLTMLEKIDLVEVKLDRSTMLSLLTYEGLEHIRGILANYLQYAHEISEAAKDDEYVRELPPLDLRGLLTVPSTVARALLVLLSGLQPGRIRIPIEEYELRLNNTIRLVPLLYSFIPGMRQKIDSRDLWELAILCAPAKEDQNLDLMKVAPDVQKYLEQRFKNAPGETCYQTNKPNIAPDRFFKYPDALLKNKPKKEAGLEAQGLQQESVSFSRKPFGSN